MMHRPIITTTEITGPDAVCPECGDRFDCATTLGAASPRPGDLSVCWNCGCLAVFTETLGLAKPKDEVELLMKMKQHERHIVLQGQAEIRKRGLRRPLRPPT